MRKITLSIFMVLIVCSLYVNAQISNGGTPFSFNKANAKHLNPEVATIAMPFVDVAALQSEDAIVDKYKDTPWRFGKNLEVSLNPANSGTWDILPNGDRLWRLRISSPGAKTINLTFDNYHLPKGASLYEYSDNHSSMIGGFTDFNNREDRIFATTLVQGDAINIEYYEPAGVKFPGELNIATVTHGYRGIADYTKSFGSSGSCQINVHCPTGTGWDNEIRAACMLVSGSNGFCSGALVNNTANDGTPYVLTANHCYSSPASWIFWFNWESPDCNDPASSPTYNSISGATLRARNVGSDFCLVEMSSVPPSNFSVYYAGWSRDTVHPTSGMCIHHPSGDIKKISPAGMMQRYDGYDAGNGAADCWQVNWSGAACTEGGSSGSPLFDPNHHIVGQLYGGPSACGASQMWDCYGRFYVSWTGGGTSSTRLSNWLDPSNTNPQVLDGYDPAGPAAPTANFIADHITTCIGDVQFTDMSSNSPTTWSWDFGDGGTSTAQNPFHSYNTNGTYTVELISGNGVGSDTLTRTSYITVNLPTAPTVTGDTVCNWVPAVLNAGGSGILRWYTAISGGSPLFTGSTYTTVPLSGTTTYYVEDSVASAPVSAGKADTVGGGGFFTNTQVYYLRFDCSAPAVLQTVDIYANASQTNKVITLLDHAGNTLQSATVSLNAGKNIVPLNFNLPADTGLRLSGPGSPGWYRNTAGFSYPITTPGVVSIKGTNATTIRYYYFYNWQIKGPDCISARVPVVAKVNVCSGIAANAGENINIYPNPVSDQLHISLSGIEPGVISIELFTLTGQSIYSKMETSATSEISEIITIAGYNPGLYLLKVSTSGQTFFQKVAIE
ncbi:MAG: PKD domain-containing protein [Bacteroidota bacterium]